MTSYKTPRMLEAEAGRGPMETWLPPMVEAQGQSGAARTLRVSRKTLRDWLLILGMRPQRHVTGRNTSTNARRLEDPRHAP